MVDTKTLPSKPGCTLKPQPFKKAGVDTVGGKAIVQNDFNTYISIANVVKDAQIIETTWQSVCPQT